MKDVIMAASTKAAILRYMCTICSTLVRKTNIDTHIKLHIGATQCELCNFTKGNLKQHVKSHLEKRFECPTCGDIYVVEQTYLDHKVTHPVSLFTQKVHYECGECGKIYFPAGRSRKSLKEDLQKHQEEHGWSPSADAKLLLDRSGAANGLLEDEWSNGDDIPDNHQDYDNGSARGSSTEDHLKSVVYEKGKQFDPTSSNVKQTMASKPQQKQNTHIATGISTSSTAVKHSKKAARHSCHICHEPFTRKPDLARHQRNMHKDAIDKKCGQCSKTFLSTKSLSVHMKRAHKLAAFVAKSKPKPRAAKHTCRVCEAAFTSKIDLNVHEKNTHKTPLTDHKCNYCSRPSFKSHNYLRAHIRKMHASTWEEFKNSVDFTAEITNKVPTDDTETDAKPSDIKNEKVSSETVEMALPDSKTGVKESGNDSKNNSIDDLPQTVNVMMEPTEDCQTPNNDDSSQTMGLNKATNKVSVSSEDPQNLCDGTASKSDVSYHSKSPNTGQELCSLCGDGFKTKAQYRKHIKQHLSNLKCATCKQEFHTMKKLKEHMNEKGCHACEVCGQRFRQRYNLVLHRSIHTGEKPFQCYQCGKTFRVKSYLEDHLRVHRGEKLFICLLCKMKFMTVGALRRHSRTHTEERPFMCSECGKGFKLHPNLNRHMRIHSGETYDCPICERKITEKSNLIKHMRIHEKRGKMVLKAAQESIMAKVQEPVPMVKPAVKEEDTEPKTVSISVHLPEQSEPVVLTIPVRSSP